ncbi:ABC transporter permease [Microtetraspora sp. NBRC 16547]|uniref:ABC transporter permease n=1 Tax=Microtetraspora sp. NBRC 16547 TaxID=3030993 RepID=UPI0024A60912|nr:ABC transporter permease [Microtetraspora sp. NBRC 16547]GLX02318.1 exporter of polyketide antibiotics [Microtetraspora sp. NBRC 16547]
MNELTGTGKLIRLILRRDRFLLPLWVLPLGVIPISYVAAINGLFPTPAGRQLYATASAHNAGFVALYGPLNGSSLGELVAWRAGFIPLVIGLFSILTVIRHTRTEEEAGRRELLGSTVTGRHAGLAAALVTTFGANLILGTILALGMIGQDLPTAGSWAFGVEFAASGWMFAAVAAVAAQLTSGAGGARGIAIVTLGAAYVLRVVGDISGLTDGPLSGLSWLSPIGWVQRISPYGDDQWWIIAPAAGFTAVFALVAVALSVRRDVGAGILPPRLGPAWGAPRLRSPLALAWRLHRGLLAGWIAGFVVLGVVLGYLAAGVGDLVRDNQQMRDIFARLGGAEGLIDNYLAGMMGLFGLIAAGYAIQAGLRLRNEETGGRAEPVLGAAVGRFHWAGSHLVFSLLGPAAVLAAAGLAMGLTHGLNTSDIGHELPRVLAGAMVQLPAVWVLAAITIALFGLLPRLTAVSWGALAICALFGLVGTALGFDEWVLDISPFTHLPRLPGGQFSAAPLVWLSAVAVALIAAGLVGLRRCRDLPIT